MNKQLNVSKLERKIISSVVIGILVFVVFSFFGDFQEVKGTVISISPFYFLVSVFFILSSYVLRFCKWHYYLRYLNMDVLKKDSFVIFFIGLSMSITPGKIGELLKTYFLKKKYGIEFSKSAPVVFAERLTDLVAMAILIGTGVFVFSLGKIYFFIGIFVLVLLFVLLQSQTLCKKLITILCSNRFLRKYKDSIITFYENTYGLLTIQPLLKSSFISVIAWFFECVSIYVLCLALNMDLSLLHNVFIYSFTTTIGALSMLPGGLGIVEGSMIGLFTIFGLVKSEAVAVTLVMRFVTLWLGVFIGLSLFFIHRKKLLKGL